MTVKTQPTSPGQTRVVGNASGTVGGASVTSVTFTCTCPAGGCLITLASGQNLPYEVAVDATSVYWTNSGSNTVMRLTPK